MIPKKIVKFSGTRDAVAFGLLCPPHIFDTVEHRKRFFLAYRARVRGIFPELEYLQALWRKDRGSSRTCFVDERINRSSRMIQCVSMISPEDYVGCEISENGPAEMLPRLTPATPNACDDDDSLATEIVAHYQNEGTHFLSPSCDDALTVLLRLAKANSSPMLLAFQPSVRASVFTAGHIVAESLPRLVRLQFFFGKNGLQVLRRFLGQSCVEILEGKRCWRFVTLQNEQYTEKNVAKVREAVQLDIEKEWSSHFSSMNSVSLLFSFPTLQFSWTLDTLTLTVSHHPKSIDVQASELKHRGCVECILFRCGLPHEFVIEDLRARIGLRRKKHEFVSISCRGVGSAKTTSIQTIRMHNVSLDEANSVANDVAMLSTKSAEVSRYHITSLRSCEDIPLHPRELRGMRYTVKMYLALRSDAKRFAEAAEKLQREGFINYFAPSRFGQYSKQGVHPGLLLLQGKFQAAARGILMEFPKNDLHAKDSAPQLQIAERLNKLGALDTPRACRNIFLDDIQTSKALVQEFLCLVWNRATSQRIVSFGSSVLDGDLVSVKGKLGFACDVSHRSRRPDVLLPIIGCGVVLPRNSTAGIIMDSLGAFGVSVDADIGRFVLFEEKQNALNLTFSGAYRQIFQVPESFEWKFRWDPKFSNDQQFSRKNCAADHAIELAFTLPASSYPTMLLRELCGFDRGNRWDLLDVKEDCVFPAKPTDTEARRIQSNSRRVGWARTLNTGRRIQEAKMLNNIFYRDSADMRRIFPKKYGPPRMTE